MELTKNEIVQRVQDWYNDNRLVGAVNIDLKRKAQVHGIPRLDWFAETLRSTADAEIVRKLQLLWEQLCFAPELWTHDGKMDVRMLVGWSPAALWEIFGIKSVYVPHKTEVATLGRSATASSLFRYLLILICVRRLSPHRASLRRRCHSITPPTLSCLRTYEILLLKQLSVLSVLTVCANLIFILS